MADLTSNPTDRRRQFEAEALPHMDALLRTALRMTRNSNDAEDLVQEAMAKAYRSWDKFESGTNCRAWLFKIMTNMFINEYRSKSRAPVSMSVDDVDEGFLYGQLSSATGQRTPEEELFARILDDDVKNAIANLPEDYRLVVMLSFIEGFSYQEIADIVDLQLGTVKSRLHRGRKLLQKKLFDYAVRNGYVRKQTE